MLPLPQWKQSSIIKLVPYWELNIALFCSWIGHSVATIAKLALMRSPCSMLLSSYITYEFRISLSSLEKKDYWNFYGDCIEAIHFFRTYCHLKSSKAWTWDIIPFSWVSFNFFQQCSVSSWIWWDLFCGLTCDLWWRMLHMLWRRMYILLLLDGIFCICLLGPFGL